MSPGIFRDPNAVFFCFYSIRDWFLIDFVISQLLQNIQFFISISVNCTNKTKVCEYQSSKLIKWLLFVFISLIICFVCLHLFICMQIILNYRQITMNPFILNGWLGDCLSKYHNWGELICLENMTVTFHTFINI